jgi:hypothetical protein
MRTYCAVSIYTYRLRRGKETAAVAVNNLVQSLSLALSWVFCFSTLQTHPHRHPTCSSRCARQGKAREGKGRGGGVAEVKPNRRVRTSGGCAFRERGERKLVSSVDRSFCFAGHLQMTKQRKNSLAS